MPTHLVLEPVLAGPPTRRTLELAHPPRAEGLFMSAAGLEVRPDPQPADRRLARLLPAPSVAAATARVLVPTNQRAMNRLLVNGRPLGELGIVVLHPGAFLTVLTATGNALPSGVHSVGNGRAMNGASDWLFARRTCPVLEPAPAELASSLCPLCGMELAHATTIACVCGAIYHQETGTLPDGSHAAPADPLDCYTRMLRCVACREPACLDPRTLPDVAQLRLGAGGAA